MITRSDDQSTTRHKKKPVSRFMGMLAPAMLISALDASSPNRPGSARGRERCGSSYRLSAADLGRAYALVRSIAQGNASRLTSSH
jgi:hypothetical protein